MPVRKRKRAASRMAGSSSAGSARPKRRKKAKTSKGPAIPGKAQKPKKSPAPKKASLAVPEHAGSETLLSEYRFTSNQLPITVRIIKKADDFVPLYEVSIASISKNTMLILEKVRQELITAVNIGMADITTGTVKEIEAAFRETIEILIKKYFPDIDETLTNFLTAYLIMKSIGMGQIEILHDDDNLEEVAINSADEPVWVYHRKHGWLKTDITIASEDQTKHFAAMIGRKVGQQISVLEPLLDAHIEEGDRVNATLQPISTHGNTLTLRKFSRDPFTITHLLRYRTMSIRAAALIWLSMQYELSAIIAGGTASGKTATLNVLASFIPPNQRIVSIEDTRELMLPKYLHWVPMSTRLPNPEGKGGVTMEDLLVNSLRMRPDRILVGEVRRQKEAETLFEAIHTGHSCYATFHANTAEETIKRLTHRPINVPETMLPAVSLILIQFRNRRLGLRRTFQVAEITDDGTPNVLQQYDVKKDVLVDKNKSVKLFSTLQLYTGYTSKEIQASLAEKELVLKYLVKNNIDKVNDVGRLIAYYYTNKDELMKKIRANKKML